MIIKFKDIPITDRPRERLKKYGCENLSNEELLAIILKVGTKDLSVLDVSRSILANYGDVKNLNYATLNKLKSLKGVGEVKATVILASIELGRRIYQTNTTLKKYNINNPRDIVSYYKEVFKDKKQEEFHIIYLDVKNNIITTKKMFIGTLNKSLVHPREIFKDAYLNSAAKIVCVHNHPSGDVTPSKEDIYITRNISEIGRIHDIILVDHLIIGGNIYFSFCENRYLK